MSAHLRPRSGAWLSPVRPVKRWKRKTELQGHRLFSPWALFRKPQQTRQTFATTMKTILSFTSSFRPLFLPVYPTLCWTSSSLEGSQFRFGFSWNLLLLAISPNWGSPQLFTSVNGATTHTSHPGLPQAKCPPPGDDQGSVVSLSRTLSHSLTKHQEPSGFLH